MEPLKLGVDTLLEVKDVALATRRSTDFIYMAIHNDRLPARRMGQRKWMLAKTDVERWIDAGMPTGPRQAAEV